MSDRVYHLTINLGDFGTEDEASPGDVLGVLKNVVWLLGEQPYDEWPEPMQNYVITYRDRTVGSWTVQRPDAEPPERGDTDADLALAAGIAHLRTGARPERTSADPENNDHNAFVQDFLTRWREQYIGTPPTNDRDMRDYRRVDEVIEMVQETYGARTPDADNNDEQEPSA